MSTDTKLVGIGYSNKIISSDGGASVAAYRLCVYNSKTVKDVLHMNLNRSNEYSL
jgi:hypothetical protein